MPHEPPALAGVLYSHGETRAASAVLPRRMGVVLEQGPVGGWDDENVSYWFYWALVGALKDPRAAVDEFRTEWLRALARRDDNWPLQRWLFAGAFTQLLVECHDVAAAATVASVSLEALDDPADASESQIKAHLSEISVPRVEPSPADVARVRALVDELGAAVLSMPGVLDHPDFRMLEGMLMVGRAERGFYRRIVPRKRDTVVATDPENALTL